MLVIEELSRRHFGRMAVDAAPAAIEQRNMLASLGLQQPLTARIAAVVPRPGAAHAAGRVVLRVEAA